MASGNQGGTHEQHVKAGQQSHKNDGGSSGGSGGSGGGSAGSGHRGQVKDPKHDGRLKENR